MCLGGGGLIHLVKKAPEPKLQVSDLDRPTSFCPSLSSPCQSISAMRGTRRPQSQRSKATARQLTSGEGPLRKALQRRAGAQPDHATCRLASPAALSRTPCSGTPYRVILTQGGSRVGESEMPPELNSCGKGEFRCCPHIHTIPARSRDGCGGQQSSFPYSWEWLSQRPHTNEPRSVC